jgi:tetratricopeptide (TPR) repeat protein
MFRWLPALLIAGVALLQADAPQNQASQDQPPAKSKSGELQKQRPKPAAGAEEIPPEEDKALTNEEFSFNPLEAEKWVRVGNYYLKQGKLRAAEGRYKGATRWNDGSADAWLRLGEVEEKLKDPQAAREAYSKYLEVAPDAKHAEQIRKKVARLK